MAQLLQEYVDSRGVTMGVDHEEGILRGVKLIGLESRNGRRYRESALSAAAALYEDAKVNVNHPKGGPLTPRDYQDRLGVIRGVQLKSGEGLFGDLHFNPKHALAEQLVWDAENNPQNVGFSHNVLARLSREGETAVVEEITKVQSVDLVADPATTQGLFEQASKEDVPQSSTDFSWDALTLEEVCQNRADLAERMQSEGLKEIQELLEEEKANSKRLQRKIRVLELLNENRLTISSQNSSEEDRLQAVNREFVELLVNASDELVIESLITERAELGRTASRLRNSQMDTGPHSRDQTLVAAPRPAAFASAQEFAATLKASRN